MTLEVKVPVLPESVAEATLLEWHKKVGDSVKRDENIVDIETDKVVLEVPAPLDGTITELLRESGDTVTAQETIAILKAGEASEQPAQPDEPAAEQAPRDDEKIEREEDISTENDTDRHGPAVNALLAEHKLDPSQINATGKDGRITKEDVLNYLKESQPGDKATAPASPPDTQTETAEVRAKTINSGARQQRREPMTRLRQTIANRLVQSQQTAAILTTFNEVDLTEVMALRGRYKEAFNQKHGIKLGFMSFFVKASVEALKRFPVINAAVDGTDIIYHDYHDIGIAVSSPRGLVVPVVRNCDEKSFAEIEQSIANYGQKAQKGAITMDEMTGGTFTITNGGTFGSMLSTPIINPPQSGILGMHNILQRPMAVNGEIKIRPMMYLALSYDHRIIDGAEAVRFLVTVKQSLEDPGRLLLSV